MDNGEASERDLGSCAEEFNQKKGEVGKLDQTYLVDGSKAIFGRNTALDIYIQVKIIVLVQPISF